VSSDNARFVVVVEPFFRTQERRGQYQMNGTRLIKRQRRHCQVECLKGGGRRQRRQSSKALDPLCLHTQGQDFLFLSSTSLGWLVFVLLVLILFSILLVTKADHCGDASLGIHCSNLTLALSALLIDPSKGHKGSLQW
jgi:hypothetical protein